MPRFAADHRAHFRLAVVLAWVGPGWIGCGGGAAHQPGDGGGDAAAQMTDAGGLGSGGGDGGGQGSGGGPGSGGVPGSGGTGAATPEDAAAPSPEAGASPDGGSADGPAPGFPGATIARLTTAPVGFMKVAPDERHVVVTGSVPEPAQCDLSGGFGRLQMVVVEDAGARVFDIAGTAGLGRIHFSSDGRYLGYQTFGGPMLCSEDSYLYAVASDGGTPRLLESGQLFRELRASGMAVAWKEESYPFTSEGEWNAARLDSPARVRLASLESALVDLDPTGSVAYVRKPSGAELVGLAPLGLRVPAPVFGTPVWSPD
jgi:hypothetical protein